MTEFRGVFANLLTAFTSDGERFDVSAQHDYVQWVLAHGVHGVSVSLSSGEFGYQLMEERADVIAAVARSVARRVPVLAGVSELSLKGTCELAVRAEASGADAVMVMPRSYLVLREDEVMNYFSTVLRAVRIPVGIYNNPGATGIDISAELYVKLVALDPERVTVSKDGSGRLFRTSDVMNRCPGFALLQGHANLLLGALLYGAAGGDFVLASVFPAHVAAIYAAVQAGDIPSARRAHDRLIPVFRLMQQIDVTRLAKSIATARGIKLGPHRPPVLALHKAEREAIERVVAELGPA